MSPFLVVGKIRRSDVKWVSMHRICRSKVRNWLRTQGAGGGVVQRLQEARSAECGGERCGACGAGHGIERGTECNSERGIKRGTECSALLLRSQTVRSRAMLCAIILLFAAFICSYAQTSTAQNAWGTQSTEAHATTSAQATTSTQAATPAPSAPSTQAAATTEATPAPAATSPSSAPAVPRVLNGNGTLVASALTFGDSSSHVNVSRDLDTAVHDTFLVGVSEFARQNKGTEKNVDGTSIGYHWPSAGANGFSLIATKSAIFVYVPQSVLDTLHLSLNDTSVQQALLDLLSTLDAETAHGGQLLSSLHVPVFFTTASELAYENYTYSFAKKQGDTIYLACKHASKAESADGALFSEVGVLTPKSDIAFAEKPSGIAALGAFLQTVDFDPLWVSLRTTGVAIIFIFLIGLITAWATIRVSSKWKGLLDTIFTIPMVLPPTVCGFLLLLLFGDTTSVGRWLAAQGIEIVFTWQAAVISCVVVGFPMMYRTVRGAFENLDASMLDAARTLGWSERRVFLRLMLPLAWPSIAAGTVLAFARAMGEFGCTLFFAGNYAGITQTIPIAIYFDWMSGKTDEAMFWVVVVILISFLVIFIINAYSARTQRYRKTAGD